MVEVETIDRAGNFIGWMFVEGCNVSLELVTRGLSKVHFTAQRSQYYQVLSEAEEKCKTARTGVRSGTIKVDGYSSRSKFLLDYK